MAGLTGSIIAFDDEIDGWLNPDLFVAAAADDRFLSPSAIVARLEHDHPNLRVAFMPLMDLKHASVALRVVPRRDPESGTLASLDDNQIFVDRRTGEVLGMRRYGACCFERHNLVPFLYELHRRLTLPGRSGEIIMGAIALAWAFDCFLGAYLTWPRARPYLHRWRRAWRMRRRAGPYRLNVDLHVAGGLWAWPVLFVLAVSSVYLNLREEVFQPMVAAFGPLTPTVYDIRSIVPPTAAREPALSFDDVLTLAAEQAETRGWRLRANGIFYDSEADFFGVDYDPAELPSLGGPSLYFDGQDGRLISVHEPGRGTAGDILMHLQFPLHSGEIIGLPGRVAVAVGGMVVLMLTTTGTIIWWRKRRARMISARRFRH